VICANIAIILEDIFAYISSEIGSIWTKKWQVSGRLEKRDPVEFSAESLYWLRLAANSAEDTFLAMDLAYAADDMLRGTLS